LEHLLTGRGKAWAGAGSKRAEGSALMKKAADPAVDGLICNLSIRPEAAI